MFRQHPHGCPKPLTISQSSDNVWTPTIFSSISLAFLFVFVFVLGGGGWCFCGRPALELPMPQFSLTQLPRFLLSCKTSFLEIQRGRKWGHISCLDAKPPCSLTHFSHFRDHEIEALQSRCGQVCRAEEQQRGPKGRLTLQPQTPPSGTELPNAQVQELPQDCVLPPSPSSLCRPALSKAESTGMLQGLVGGRFHGFHQVQVS